MRKGMVIIRRCSCLGITTKNEGLLTIRKETRCWSKTIIMFSPDFKEERIFFIHLHPPFSHLESFFVISFIWFSSNFTSSLPSLPSLISFVIAKSMSPSLSISSKCLLESRQFFFLFLHLFLTYFFLSLYFFLFNTLFLFLWND